MDISLIITFDGTSQDSMMDKSACRCDVVADDCVCCNRMERGFVLKPLACSGLHDMDACCIHALIKKCKDCMSITH